MQKPPENECRVNDAVPNSAVTVRYQSNHRSGSDSPQCEHAEYVAAATLVVKSNGLPLRKCRVEIGRPEEVGVAALGLGQEHLPAPSRREASGRDD